MHCRRRESVTVYVRAYFMATYVFGVHVIVDRFILDKQTISIEFSQKILCQRQQLAIGNSKQKGVCTG